MTDNIKEIDKEIEELSKKQSELSEKEVELIERKRQLLLMDIINNKPFNRYKWKVKRRGDKEILLEPIFDEDFKFDDIQTKLDLYPHGIFEINDNIEIYGSDGDLYIISRDVKVGMEFVKSQDMEIEVKSIIDTIESMENQIKELKEFLDSLK